MNPPAPHDAELLKHAQPDLLETIVEPELCCLQI
jgi:hypothetical protein